MAQGAKAMIMIVLVVIVIVLIIMIIMILSLIIYCTTVFVYSIKVRFGQSSY